MTYILVLLFVVATNCRLLIGKLLLSVITCICDILWHFVMQVILKVSFYHMTHADNYKWSFLGNAFISIHIAYIGIGFKFCTLWVIFVSCILHLIQRSHPAVYQVCNWWTKLQKNTNRKPYTIYWMIPLSMILSDLWLQFQGHDIFQHGIS